ncbi:MULTISPECIES: SRPBCC family protein [unclassified Leifsonia]|uniref:SRPBCC family protein n=1 Tax=unclassified Leifsonia TaxID=2663824 RepID=UPI0008A7DA8B|nr:MULTISPECIES: SRPBCC family protein [unclassified Leifsonia]SEH59666.1 Uncharacterized conserved protein YndB, AHSA1/START domain [Leifsonia sp. CL154]SFL19444.1 Uncharacterized conserved protein YndB, AHSA1/START domain [Leifsonia sp. CL147]
MTTTARADIRIDASRERLWEALTDPGQIEKYLFGSRVSTDWKPGSPIVYRGEWEGKPYEDKGTILEVVPGERLVSSYFSPLSGKPDAPESYVTLTYTLSDEPEGGEGPGTRVTFTQDGCADDAEAERLSGNWRMVLESLKSVVEGG